MWWNSLWLPISLTPLKQDLTVVCCRAATHDYFPYRLIIFWTNQLFDLCLNCLFPRAQGEVFKCLVLFDQQSKTQIYSVYDDIKQIKAANPHI